MGRFYLNDPMVSSAVRDSRGNRVIMGNWFSDLVEGVKSDLKSATIKTGTGEIVLNQKTGVSYTTGQPATASTINSSSSSVSPVASSAVGAFTEMLKKPEFLLSLAGLAFLLLNRGK